MPQAPLVVNLKKHREKSGLSQKSLAEKTGITRQSLISIESGRQTPSIAVALAMARILGVQAEDLFRFREEEELDAQIAYPALGQRCSQRVAMAKVDGKWVAHRLPINNQDASDGVLLANTGTREGRIQPLASRSSLKKNILVAGCAPLLQVLAQHSVKRFADSTMRWVPASSKRALDLLDFGLIHIAGTHLADESSGQYNLPFVREQFGRRKMEVVNLVCWQQGIVVPEGNPKGIHEVSDLLRPDIVIAWRGEGSGAHKLLQRHFKQAGATEGEIPGGPQLQGHMEVAQAVAFGGADAGVAIEAAALAYGLDFIPLSYERFDLVLHSRSLEEEAVGRLVESMGTHAFRREIDAIGGYDSTETGVSVSVEAQTADS
jgi:putative molybdopterin biosynthesis protein